MTQSRQTTASFGFYGDFNAQLTAIFQQTVWWHRMRDSLEEAKHVLESNQYPPSFYEPIINKALTKIVSPPEITDTTEEEKDSEQFLVIVWRSFLQDKKEGNKI